MAESVSICILGGSGFVGKALIRELTAQQPVITADRIRIMDLTEPELPEDPGMEIEFIKGDIRDRNCLERAFEGVDLVFHLAAVVDWGVIPEQEVYDINFNAPKLVTGVCKSSGVRYLVFTSSLDAIISGKPIVDADEKYPYPEKYPNAYCRSKALAEQHVASASDGSLLTAVIRPGGIYGEADPYHLGSLVELLKNGSYFRIGDGSAPVENVYVGNVAYGHLMAAKALIEGNSRVPGNIYFIGDHEAEGFFPFLERVLEKAGFNLPPANRYLPRIPLYILGCIAEGFAFILRPVHRFQPKLSRFAVNYITTQFTFTYDKAARDFGYKPKYSMEEAISRSAAYFQEEPADVIEDSSIRTVK